MKPLSIFTRRWPVPTLLAAFVRSTGAFRLCPAGGKAAPGKPLVEIDYHIDYHVVYLNEGVERLTHAWRGSIQHLVFLPVAIKLH